MDRPSTRQENRIPHAQASVGFITECSTGFARGLSKLVIERGGRVVVTAPRPEQVADRVAGHEESALALDITRPDQVASAVKSAEDRFGKIEVRRCRR